VALSIDSRLHGLNARTGEQMWLYESSAPALKLRGATNPLLIDDYALVGFANGQVGLFQLDNGAIAWVDAVAVPHGRSDIERMVDINGRMVRHGDTAYVVTYNGKLAAIEMTKHETLWTKDMSSYVGVAADERDVVVTDSNDNIYLLDRFTGETQWKQSKLQGRYLTTPVFFRDYVVVADVYGYAYAFSRRNGEMLGMDRIFRAAVRVSPLADSEGIYLQSHPGRLFKLDIEPIRS
jgi:outer membrane protein assembly factor BamB